MEETVESQELVKKFLLGQLAENEYAIVEQRIFTDQEYFSELLLTEGELIDDFVFGALSRDDQERMQRHFLVVPERLEDLRITKALERYVSKVSPERLDSDWEETLRQAHKNRSLIESLISEDWAGLKVLVLLRDSSKTRRELEPSIEDETLNVGSTLARLVQHGLTERVGSRFLCTRLGIETLQKIEYSFEVQLTP